jgi:superfamily II DNA/RNA helicase
MIHGDRSQSQRTAALTGFQRGQYRVLVATVVAARGIPVQDIAIVINYDLPEVAENFIHRVGRTGRAGERGVASTLFVSKQRTELLQLERALGIRIERVLMNGKSFERSARPSTWHGAHNGDIRPQDGSFARGIPASTDRKLISGGRSTAGFGDGRTLKRISVPSWMCRVCCSFETSRSI